jgi:hypothetical protein
MKKVLLILFVLAICVLAFPHGVMAAPAPGTAQIDATVIEFTDFTASGDATWNMYYFTNGLEPSAPTNNKPDALVLTAKSNNPWHVTVLGTNNGFLRPWGSGAYSGTALANALHIVDPGDLTVSGSAQNLVAAGQARTDAWTDTFSYRQLLTLNDDPASTYRITLTLEFVNEG